MDDETQVSIHLLLDSLCKSIFKDVCASKNTIAHHPYGPSVHQKSDKLHSIPKKVLKKCKLRSYEILLKKNSKKDSANDFSPIDEGYSDVFDPIHELKFCQFEYDLFVGQIQAQFHTYGYIQQKHKEKILQKFEMFRECVSFVEKNAYFKGEQNEGNSILSFLLLLKNHSNKLEKDGTDSMFALQTNQIMSMPSLEPKIFALNREQELSIDRNPYCSESMCRLLNNQLGMPKFSSSTSCALSNNDTQRNHINTVAVNKAVNPSKVIIYMSNKWEELGHRYFLPETSTNNDQFATFFERKFSSECTNSSLNLTAIQAHSNRKLFQARIVDTKEFIKHIKLLLIGIESESFIYNADNMSFKLLDHLTVVNLMTSTVNHFITDFIECGTCYKRLKVVIAKGFNNFKLKYDGFLFKVTFLFLFFQFL